MKKSLLSLAVGAMTLLTASFSASADVVAEGFTLKQKALINEGLPACTDARQAALANHNLNIYDKSKFAISVWDKTISNVKTIPGATKHSAITSDDAGNLIQMQRTSWWAGAGAPTVLEVYPADGSAMRTIDISAADLQTGRLDYWGHIRGNILSGKAMMCYPLSNTNNVYVLPFIDGALDVENVSTLTTTATEEGNIVMNDNLTIVSAISDTELLIVKRGNGNTIRKLTISKEVKGYKLVDDVRLVTPNHNNIAGFDTFSLCGVQYIVYPSQSNDMDGFSIAPLSTDSKNEEVAQKAETRAGVDKSIAANWVFADVIDNTKVDIFQYLPGGYIAVYEFTVPEPEMYIVGTSGTDGSRWYLSNPAGKMTLNEQGVFEVKGFQLNGLNGNGDAYFVLSEKLGTTWDDWNTINANRYEPTENDFWVTPGMPMQVVKGNTNKSWKLAPGKYTVYFNKETMELTLQNETSGVEEIAEAATITVQAGGVVVNAENAMAQVYTVAGQLVNDCRVNGEAVIELPAGFYIVKVADTVKKVIVR